MRATQSSYLVRVVGVNSMHRELLGLLQGLFGRLLGATLLRLVSGSCQIHTMQIGRSRECDALGAAQQKTHAAVVPWRQHLPYSKCTRIG